MTTYTFIYEEPSFKLIINKDTLSEMKHDLGLNIEPVLNIDKANARTIYDIMKDAAEEPPVSNINRYLEQTFNMTKGFPNNYKKQLHDMENESIFMGGDEVVHFNVIKTSTYGGLEPILKSNATNIVYESGMGPEMICVVPIETLIIWDTPAAHLDPASKITANNYFPNNKDKIIFDGSFTTKLGFPHNLEWSAADISATADTPIHEVTINAAQYIDKPLKVTIDLKNESFSPKTTGIAHYSLSGNKKKNTQLNKEGITSKLEDIFKYLLLKELGDVAQVWLYYALIIVNLFITEQKELINTYLMLTTDSIVYFLCKVLQLPVGYTGSRTGVQRGHCTVKFFTIGKPNYKTHLRNLLLMESKRIEQHNLNNSTAIRNILKPDDRKKEEGLISLYLFDFHIILPDYLEIPSYIAKYKTRDKICEGRELINGVVPSEHSGRAKNSVDTRPLDLNEQKVISDNIKIKLERIVDTINQLNDDLKEFVKSKNEEFDRKDFTNTTSASITGMYYDLLNELKKYKCEQYITVLKKMRGDAKYMFNKTEVLQDESIIFYYKKISEQPFQFLQDCIPGFLDVDDDEDSFDALLEEEDVETSGGSRSPVGGGQFNENKNIGYYEYLLLYFVYTFWFQKFKIVDNIVPLTTDRDYCLFAKYYDMLVWECSNNNWNLDTWNHPQFSKHFNKIFNKKTDEEIVELGKQLSNYINFYNFEETSSFNIQVDQLKLRTSKLRTSKSRSSKLRLSKLLQYTRRYSSKLPKKYINPKSRPVYTRYL